MCGRFLLTTPVDALGQLFLFDERPNLPARYNVAPSQDVPIVRRRRGAAACELVLARWGLVPFWAKDAKIGYKLINARAEGIREKPAFREAFLRGRRCLIPADGFYEWQELGGNRKQPFLIRPSDRQPVAFAGLFELWRQKGRDPTEPLLSCTILTTEANPSVAPLHDRMPVILRPETFEAWLGGPPDEVQELLAPYPAEELEAVPVSSRVNSPANDDPDLIRPLEAVPETGAADPAPRMV